MISFKILANNTVKRRGLLAEHGLSLLIKIDNSIVLFDTGQTKAFAYNADTDGIDLSLVDYIVISHGHYDHCGGLREICKRNKQANIFIHSKATVERYNAIEGKPVRENIGIPWKINSDEYKNRIVNTESFLNLEENIFISGGIPRVYDDIKNLFVYCNDEGVYEQDNVIDEQFLAIKGNEGIYIFSGCSHAGVRNIIKYAKDLFPKEQIAGFIGGLHLSKSSSESINKTIDELVNEDIGVTIPLHCTGIVPSCILKERLQDRCILLNTGDEYILEH